MKNRKPKYDPHNIVAPLLPPLGMHIPPVYVIELNGSEGRDAWFSIKVAKDIAASMGWTHELEDATQFAREQDAQHFIDRYIPTPGMRVVRK